MAYVQKPGQGSLFKNDRKEAENHPDLKGTINIDGKVYWLSGWKKENDRGEWISLSAKLKEDRQESKAASYDRPAPIRKPPEDLDDEIPFALLLPLAFAAYHVLPLLGGIA